MATPVTLLTLGAEPVQHRVAPRTVEQVITESAGEHGVLAIEVGEGAGVQLVVPHLPAALDITVTVEARAQFSLAIASSFVNEHKVAVAVKLLGRGANALLLAGVVGVSEGQLDIGCMVEHVAPQTYARMTVRRVGSDSSFSKFSGMLKVAPGAHGTDTYLSDKSLLMGEKSRAVSVPGLEILADDVHASHGATVGRPSADELFYLRSRGLPEADALQLLVRAFLAPALIGVPDDILRTLLPLVHNPE